MKKIYCGGPFSFDYKNENYIDDVKTDYRYHILNDVNLLLNESDYVLLNDNVKYIGPFYFEADNKASDIVFLEKGMIEESDILIFLLDSGLCPGTISELIYASTLNKEIAIFYINYGDEFETESELHTPCWYPIILSELINENVRVIECSKDNYIEKIEDFINLI